VITDPVILIRINRLFRPGLSPEELYDVTRSSWVVGPRRGGARYAFAVFRADVIEVYEIDNWQRTAHGRWEFRGRLAPDPVRSRYAGTSVKSYFKPGNQNPILYINC